MSGRISVIKGRNSGKTLSFSFSQIPAVSPLVPCRGSGLASADLTGARQPVIDLGEPFARLSVGRDGAFEFAAADGGCTFVRHGGKDTDTAVGRLGVAKALSTPGKSADELMACHRVDWLFLANEMRSLQGHAARQINLLLGVPFAQLGARR